MKQIFIINGMARSGKDSVCSLVGECGHNVFTVSLVDKVREIAAICGCDPDVKTEKNRKFTADLADLLTRYNNLPMNYIKKQIKQFKKDSTKDVMFIHMRKPVEIDKLKKECPNDNIKTVFVENENVPKITSNSADAGVFDYHYDYIIHNNGTLDELKETVKDFVTEVLGNKR